MLKQILIATIGIFASCKASCEYPWVQPAADSKCYTITHDKLTWYQADVFCKQHGGYLAEPRTSEETDMLDDYIMPELSYWIGLTDLVVEGQFLWSTDYSEPEYTNWYAGQPNKNGDCVQKYYGYGDQWDDANCDYATHGICEKPSSN